ncbi:MAG: TadE family protein [Fuerstiella sp.]
MRRQPCRRQLSYNSRGDANRGVTVVEFTLVAPIFFLMLFAAMEFAIAGTIRSTANNAAYEAARQVVVPGASHRQGIDEAERIMSIVGVRSMAVDVNPAVIDETTRQVTIDIAIPYSENAFFTPWFMGDVTIRSTCTLNTERSDGT